jgi:hypothetical protein
MKNETGEILIEALNRNQHILKLYLDMNPISVKLMEKINLKINFNNDLARCRREPEFRNEIYMMRNDKEDLQATK